MKLADKIKLPEGRRLEFKETLPSNADFTKTVIAFANDAGGELFIGVKNNPRSLIGIPENQLDGIENKISNIIHDSCTPIIQPEISFLEENKKYFIRIYIHKGSKPPYFLKNKGKDQGTSFRVAFINQNYLQQQKLQQELQHELKHELQHESLFTKVLKIISSKGINTKGIATILEQKSISGQLKKTLSNLLEKALIEWTIPEKPKSKNQQYRITDRGIAFLQLLHQKNKPN